MIEDLKFQLLRGAWSRDGYDVHTNREVEQPGWLHATSESAMCIMVLMVACVSFAGGGLIGQFTALISLIVSCVALTVLASLQAVVPGKLWSRILGIRWVVQHVHVYSIIVLWSVAAL